VKAEVSKFHLSGAEDSMTSVGDDRSILSSLNDLSSSAAALNAATQRLAKSVEVLDDALKKLNLGISSWVDVSLGSSPDNRFSTTERLGYAKVNGKWGLALKVIDEDMFAAEPDVTTWLFCDASRELRIRAVPLLPKLMAQLNRDAKSITTKISESAREAEEFARAIEVVAQNHSLPEPALKEHVVQVLHAAKSQGSAADAIESAKWSAAAGVLSIQTDLSKTMLPMVINQDADRMIRNAIKERAPEYTKIELQPGRTFVKGESK
jgi:hypothetical protein